MRVLSLAPTCLAYLWLALLCACGPQLPPRYVVEKDVGSYRYSRYQQVLDVEIPITGNAAVGHTATYVRGGQQLRVTPAFVTVYEQPRGLTETVRQRLRNMPGYALRTREVADEHVWEIQGEGGDLWLVWVSGPHLLKLGVPEGKTQVPEALAELYLDLYPSDLDAKGRAKKDSASAGGATEGPADSADSTKVTTP